MKRDRSEGREALDTVSSFIFSARSITAYAVDISCVYSLYTLMKVRHQPVEHTDTHTHSHSISSLKSVFPICVSQHMFVYMVYTEGAVI